MLNLTKLFYLLNEREERLYVINSSIGSQIKLLRKEKGLTLEEVARNTCSISYLSKLENNLLKASVEILDGIETNLGIKLTETDHKYNALFENIIDELKQFIENKIDLSKVDKNNLNHKYLLSEFYNATIDRDNKKIYEFYQKLLLNIQSLTNDELVIFSYGLLRYMFNDEKYADAVFFLEHLKKANKEPLKLQFSLLEAKARIYSKENVDSKLISEIKESLVGEMNNEVTYDFLFSYSYYLTKFASDPAIMDQIASTKLEKEDKLFITALAYFRMNKFNEALLMLSAEKLNKEETKILKLVVLDKLGKLKKEDFNIEIKRESYRLIYSYLKVKHIDPSKTIDYIRQKSKDINMITQNLLITKYFFLEISHQFIDSHYYKEATQYLTQFINLAE